MIPHLVYCDDLVEQAIITLSAKLIGADSHSLHHVVLTGGHTGRLITGRLADVAKSLPEPVWSRTHFWWGDERIVASESPDRNDRGIKVSLGKYFIESNIHRVRSYDACHTVEESADEYGRALLTFGAGGRPPRFTLVFAGVGPDGHIASLFPNRPELDSRSVAVAVHDSPKPPPERVTLSLPTLNNSNCTVLLIGGETKREALNRIMAPAGVIATTPARGLEAAELYALTDLLVTV